MQSLGLTYEDGAPKMPLPIISVAVIAHDPNERRPRVVVAIWGDGRVIWSDEAVRSGPPYRQGQVGPDAVRKLLAKWTKDGHFNNPGLSRQDFS